MYDKGVHRMYDKDVHTMYDEGVHTMDDKGVHTMYGKGVHTMYYNVLTSLFPSLSETSEEPRTSFYIGTNCLGTSREHRAQPSGRHTFMGGRNRFGTTFGTS